MLLFCGAVPVQLVGLLASDPLSAGEYPRVRRTFYRDAFAQPVRVEATVVVLDANLNKKKEIYRNITKKKEMLL